MMALEQKKWRDDCLCESRRWTDGVMCSLALDVAVRECSSMLLRFVSNAQMESVNRIELEMHRKLKKRRFCEAEQTEIQKFGHTQTMLPRQQNYKVQRLHRHSHKVTTSLTTSKPI
jgi:hypothetical protein